MKPTFNTLSADQKDIVINGILGIERARSGYWKSRQWMCFVMAFMAIVGGWLIQKIAVGQDDTSITILGTGKWLMIMSVVFSFCMWLVVMYAARKDHRSTEDCINKAAQEGLDLMSFRNEVVALANAAYDE